jgi:SAM-dependent methyltransferase
VPSQSIRKVFLPGGPGGEAPAYWDHVWHQLDLSAELERLEAGEDPIVRWVRELVPRTGLTLESGCGSGRVVALLSRSQGHVIGLDFATKALQDAKKQIPDLRLVGGQVERLPFRSETFDCIISLGVIEHFEDGPRSVLQEHRRLLKRGGRLLLAAPRLSPLKRWVDWRSSLKQGPLHRSWRNLLVTSIDEESLSASRIERSGIGYVSAEHPIFYQYEFPRRYVLAVLRESSFQPISIRPCDVIFGLQEAAPVRSIIKVRKRQGDGSATRGLQGATRLRRFLRWEKADSTVGRAVLGALQEVAGHMYFVVAVAN